jgi:hypothetical protein
LNQLRKRVVPPTQKVDTYAEDLVPLREFLQTSDANDGDTLSSCLCFLTIVNAERPHALRPMIRLMTRQDTNWRRNAETIVSLLDEINVYLIGTRLDKFWLLDGASRKTTFF